MSVVNQNLQIKLKLMKLKISLTLINVRQLQTDFLKYQICMSLWKKEDTTYENIQNLQPIPEIQPWLVNLLISEAKCGSSTVKGDLPIKFIKEFGPFLAEPIAHIWNSAIKNGEYPKLWKIEIVTPIPKCYPPEKIVNLRKISGTKNVSKLFEKFLCKMIVEDMKLSADTAQYGNKKKISIQHLLVWLIDRILKALD